MLGEEKVRQSLRDWQQYVYRPHVSETRVPRVAVAVRGGRRTDVRCAGRGQEATFSVLVFI